MGLKWFKEKVFCWRCVHRAIADNNKDVYICLASPASFVISTEYKRCMDINKSGKCPKYTKKEQDSKGELSLTDK